MNLVAQGPAMTEADATTLASFLKKKDCKNAGEHAFRFANVERTAGIAEWCEQRRIDHAWIAEGRRFADLELLAIDMDSTLITMETIDELGDCVGRKPEIAAITAQAMRGEIDYPESLRRRVALLEGLEASALQRVYDERLGLTAGAEALIAACKRHGVKLLLVSGGFSFFTDRLKTRLGLDYTISNTLEVANGRLTGGLIGPIVDAEAKARKFLEVLTVLKIEKNRSIAIGDGANDLKMMALAGLSVAFHAKPVVRAQASCALSFSGLDGVVNLLE